MRNLLGRLLDRPPQSLAAIAQQWDVELRGRDPHQDVGQLYRILIDPWAFALMWERLPTLERAVIDALCAAEGALTADELGQRLDVPTDEMLPALRRLYRAGLLFQRQTPPQAGAPPPPDRFFLPRELAFLANRLRDERRRGLPDHATSDELAERLDDRELSEIAQHLGYRVIPAVALRADLVAYVAPRLGDPDVIRDSVRSLDPTAARLWNWLVEQDGLGDPAEAEEALRLTQRTLRQALHALSRRGLAWRGYLAEANDALRIVVPAVVLHPKPAPAAPPPELDVVDERLVDLPPWAPAHAAAWDLLTLVRDIVAGRARWRRGGAGDRSATALRQLAPRLWLRSGDLPPSGYVPFLVHLAESLGLLLPDGGIVSDRLRVWTRMSFPEQARRLVALWRGATDWPEGAGREALQVWGADWPGFRERLLELLGTLDPDTWYTVASVTARFAAETPGALGSHFTAAASHEPGEDSPEARRQAVVRLAADVTLATGAAWLGLIELARAQRRGMVLRVRPEMAWLVDEAAPVPPEPALGAHTLVVQPNFEVLLLRPAPRHVWALSAFTELEQLDRVSHYRLTRAGIEAGLASGLSLERLTRFLEEASGEPLPQNVAYQMADWTRAYRRVRLRHAVLLDPDDRTSLDELMTALIAAGLRGERLGERLLVWLPSGGDGVEARVEEVLRQLGRTPQWPAGGS